MIVQTVETPRSPRPLAETNPAELGLAFVAPDPDWPRRADLIGRERELALLISLVDRAPETGAALLIRGAPGAGKTALIRALVAQLPDRPAAVLRASGIRAEVNLPYAGLHQLLRPVLRELGSLPRPQRRAIEAAFGIAESPAPDPFLIAIATLDLLSMAARPSLVVVVEDAQWLDRRTSEVLSFVARRLSSDRIVLLVTARDDRRCPILDAGLAELRLDGLADDDAGSLLTTVAPGIAEPVEETATFGDDFVRAGEEVAALELADADVDEAEQLEDDAEQLDDEADQLDDLDRARLQLPGAPWVAEIADGAMTTDLVRTAEAALAGGDGMLARRLLWTAAQQTMCETGEGDGRPAVRSAAARMGQPGDDPWLLAIAAAVGSADAASICEMAARYEQPDALPTDLLLVGMASAIAGDAARSRSLLARAAPAFRGEEDRPPLAALLVMQAWNDIHLGRWTEAASEVEAGAELARNTGQAMWSVVADIASSLLAALRGDEDQVERALARVGPAAIGRGSGWVASTVEVVRGINELSAGRPELAFVRLQEQLGSSAPEAVWAVDQFADAAVLSGRVDEGRAVLEASSGQGDASHGPLHIASHVYAGAVLADDGTADERQGLAIDELADWPIHRARLQLHRGRWLRRNRRVADSRMPLRAAHDVFEAVGAAPLAERARRELRASGERIRRREITAWDQLSPQETEIAHLAAEGLSNREIGEQLFLSHRTVGAHLYRIFPKLGVTSRGQLHRVLATTNPDGLVGVAAQV